MSGSLIDIVINLTKAIIILFIIVDPFGDIPIFMGLTEKMTGSQKRKVFNTASIVGFVLLLVFAITGQEIFTIFGISIFSFEVAGGILLLIIAIRILISGSLHESADSPESIGAVPIAMPLLSRSRSHYNHHIQPTTIRLRHSSRGSLYCNGLNMDNPKIHGFSLQVSRQNRIPRHRTRNGSPDCGHSCSIHFDWSNTLHVACPLELSPCPGKNVELSCSRKSIRAPRTISLLIERFSIFQFLVVIRQTL